MFNLVSVQLGEYSTVVPDAVSVHFVGYRHDGSIVTTDFTTDGIIDRTGPLADFETFYFDKEFSDLVRFEVPSYGFAMDNLVYFDVVPEPSGTSLLGLGFIAFCFLSRKRQATAEP